MWPRLATTLLILTLFGAVTAVTAAAAGFTESEDRPVKDPDNSQDNPLTAAAPIPWNLAAFATAFPNRAVLVRGTLDAGDSDAYAVSLATGQLILAAVFEDAAGERNDFALGLFAGTAPPALASDDDAGPGFAARLAFAATSTGTQRIAVSGFGDTAWNGAHQEAKTALLPYTLVIAAASNPPALQESGSNDTLASANALPSEAGVIGASLAPGDLDHFKLDLEAGDRLAVSVFDLKSGLFQSASGERNDAVVGIFSPSGSLLASGLDDDGGPGFMPNRLFTVPAGQGGSWKIAVTGFGDSLFTGAHTAGPFDYLLVVARERACPNVTPLISNLVTSTGKTYLTAALRGGDHYYTDRTVAGRHVLVDIPAAYECSQWIRTANDDKSVSSTTHLSFTLSQAASVFVGYDTRASAQPPPPWLANGFTALGEIVDVADPDPLQEFALFRRDFAAGSVVLGGNHPSGSGSNYVVFARPLDTLDPAHAFAISGLPASASVTIAGVTVAVQRLAGQTDADLAASLAAAVNANATLAAAHIFGLASGAAFVTTGTIQSYYLTPVGVPVLPAWGALLLCAALGLTSARKRASRGFISEGASQNGVCASPSRTCTTPSHRLR